MIKSDKWIKKMALEHKMIEPFEESQVGAGVVSFGVSSYGYDMRLANDFLLFSPENVKVQDPKKSVEGSFVEIKTNDFVVVPPNSFCLAKSYEYFRIPRNILCITYGKSTYARCGVLVNVTPLEPEWEGHITISISNISPRPVKLYSNEGIAQVVFLGAAANGVCEKSYADKKGKYQAQKNITLAKIK